jgi:hypothetical protein
MINVLAQSIGKHKHSPKQVRQKEKDSFAMKTIEKKNVDKSIGKPTHSHKQGRHKDAHCDAVTTKDKSKIENQFFLAHKVDKVNMKGSTKRTWCGIVLFKLNTFFNMFLQVPCIDFNCSPRTWGL